MKPCTRRGPKIGKKHYSIESCDVQTLDNQVMQLLAHIWRSAETYGKQQLDNPN